MDLGTIKQNLAAKAYDYVEDFAADVRQVFINCSEYCRPRGKEARAGIRLSAFFETQYSDMGLDATETRTTRSRRIWIRREVWRFNQEPERKTKLKNGSLSPLRFLFYGE